MDPAAALNPERLSAAGLFFGLLCLGALGAHASVCQELPVFSPSRLVVKFGDPATATCSICNGSCDYDLRVEEPFQATSKKEKEVVWSPSSVSQWSVEPLCYIFNSDCTSALDLTVYQPPQRVALSFRNHSGPLLEDHSGPLLEGHLYSLLCEVGAVAPAQNMTVAFYRGLRELSVQNSSSAQKTPVNKNFSLDYSVSRDDHGAQFWCEARLELGPEGPQPPPVVRSQNITANVHHKPYFVGPAEPELSATQGQSAELDCSTEGNPEPLYSWSLPSASAFRGHVLIIPSVSSQHQGVYTCTASNALGALSRSFTLSVHEVPTTEAPALSVTPAPALSVTPAPALSVTPAPALSVTSAPALSVTPPPALSVTSAPALSVTPADKNCATVSMLHLSSCTCLCVYLLLFILPLNLL